MMTAAQNTGAARVWNPQMLQAWEDIKPLIISRLNRKGGHVQDADDVHQNTWLAAHAALDAYDPLVAGSSPAGPTPNPLTR